MNLPDATMPAKAIGILGGTFDPIHYGHIKPALKVAGWLQLQQISLLPAHIPPHKTQTGASASQRVAMLQQLCAVEPMFSLDTRELNRTGPSYTVDTLTELRHEQPNASLFFFIGMDSLLTITSWHRWQQLLQLCHLVVSPRPGFSLAQANAQVQQLLQQHQLNDPAQARARRFGAILIAPDAAQNVSSTEIREKLRAGADCSALLPDVVIDYIRQHRLYRD